MYLLHAIIHFIELFPILILYR